MKQSQLFTKTRKEAPADEVAKNASLLIRAGFIHKEMAGVYSYLPLGLRVLNKIALIIREEMNALGGQEVQLSSLQNKDVWQKTGRWDEEKVTNWFKTEITGGKETRLGFTHEEPLTAIMAGQISSYKDLPKYVYQIQTKFRNEERAKSGMLRGREFLMKDLYSFSKDQKEHDQFYEKVAKAYEKIFQRVGIGAQTHKTFASGGVFSEFSHEFQTVTEAGEDTIFICEKDGTAVNREVFTDEVLSKMGKNKSDFQEFKAIEVGNIFSLGTRFSEPLGLFFKDDKGEDRPVIMGSYGMGLGRLMGTVAEILSDEKGLLWPKEISPFSVHLISIGAEENPEVKKQADKIYEKLEEKSVEVLYDDREARAGEKFADSDLMGIPTRVVLSEKNIKEGRVEVKGRTEKTPKYMTEDELFGSRF
ncbi:MAG: aminoacyl--tRNA ligase-related protein [bacterium]|nr:aminoacyl--tRNA ligase-related protein [bacterium]